MFKHRLMLSAAVTALFAVPALATTTISTKQTTEVQTSKANNGNPDDVTIAGNGSVVINAAGPAVLVDSNNLLDNEGTISNKDKDGAEGVIIDATGTTAPNQGPFGPPPAGTTDFFKTNGLIDLTGTGSGKTGFLFKSGTSAAIAQVTGDFDFTPSSQLLMQGDNSVGVSMGANTKLIGNLNTLGIITLNQGKVADTAGSGLIGIDLAGEVTKNFKVGGQVNVIGESGTGILVAPTGVVDGVFWNTGTIFSTGIQVADNKAVNPEGGSAVVINGNILGGFYNQGPTSASDNTTAGVISMQGTGAAFSIGPGVGGVADVTLGAIDNTATGPLGFADASNTDKFGFINHGSILAAPIDANQSAGVIALNIGGSSLFRTIVQNGILNTGSIAAASNSASGGKTPAAAGAAIGLQLAQLADVPKIVNQSFGTTGSGTISAAVTGTAGGSAVGILITQTAIPIDTSPPAPGTGGNPAGNNVNGTLEIDNLAGAQIVASAVTSDPSNATLSAVAIQDLSGKLTKIVNEGTISASVSTLTKNNQKAVAIDAHANSLGITIDDGTTGVSGKAGTIIGDVLLGSGSDVVTVSGLDAADRSLISGVLNFGSNTSAGAGANDQLIINPFATVSSAIQSSDGHLDVSVANNGFLVLNDAALPTPAPTILHSLLVSTGGELDVTVAEGLGAGAIQAQSDGTTNGSITLQSGAKFGINFGSFIGATNNFVLLDAPAGQLTIPDAAQYAADFTTPFLFTGGMCTVNVALFAGTATECAVGTTSTTHSQLLLALTPKTAADLQLTGFAAQMYPIVTQVLPKDNALGAAVVTGVTDNAIAQQVFDAFAPVVNGGSKSMAVAFTDQATGPIGARQRVLRTYGKQAGESTLWAVEYAQFLKDPGHVGSSGVDSTGAPTTPGLLTGFKDHGFGFSLGGDGGSASDGWYGGALSFYTGDIGGLGTAVAQNQSQTEWYMLSGYTDWRGRGLFLDTNLDVGVTQYKTKRILNIVTAPSTTFSRTAQSKHIGVFLAGGVTTGAIFKYSGTTITPQISIDGLTMRENGYTESNGLKTTTAATDGFDLAVGAAYTNSLRSFLGVDVRQDIDLGDFFLQPEGRVGYRYDFIGSPQKVTANFVSLPGTTFTVNGPDPAQGNIVAGATISASTDTWSIGVSYDWVRGENGATQQSGQLVLVGRI